MKRRNFAIMILRVTAVILVVLGHATRNAYEGAQEHVFAPDCVPYWETLLRKYIYSFHMPLFFWISGLVFYLSMEQRNWKFEMKSEILKKARRLLLPLFATSIFVVWPSIALFGRHAKTALEQGEALLLIHDNDQLWFLRVLFLLFLFAIPLASVPRVRGRAALVLLGAMLCCAAAVQRYLPEFFQSMARFAPFFFAGILSAPSLPMVERRLDKPGPAVVWVALLFSVHVFFLAFHPLQRFSGLAQYYITATAGIFFMFSGALLAWRVLEKSVTGRYFVVRVDAFSYGIYLFHMVPIYVLLYTVHLGLDIPPWLRVCAAFSLGLAFAVVLVRILSRFSIPRMLFSLPDLSRATRDVA